jgi:hypothetical protein
MFSINRIGNNLFIRTINFALKSSITDSLLGHRAMNKKGFKELFYLATALR